LKVPVLIKASLVALSICGVITAESYDVKLEKTVGYKDWGTKWDTIFVLKNDLVTLAVLPKIGGRIMQYDLGTHPSMYIDENAKNVVPENGNSVVGGYRTLPSPQSDFSWPSPSELDCKPYKCKVLTNNADSTVIYLESDIVNSTDDKYKTHQGLQFKRVITMYKASSHVKVEVTMLNKGNSTINHGIWDITQSDCTNKGEVDIENFWVYFRKNPTSTLGGGNGWLQYMDQGDQGETQWKPDAAPGGIMGVQYQQVANAKIGADCSAGWIAFVDRLDGYAYIKKFTYENGKTYPDSGASVQVYTYASMNMIEVEVLGPLTSLSHGDSTKMTENWFSARTNGPVLDVNDAGLITSRLTAQQTADSMSVKGTYGLFYPGKVKCVYVNSANSEIASVDSFSVVPTDSLKVSKKYKVPSGAATLRLDAYNSSGKRIGTLDTVKIDPVSIIDQGCIAKSATRNTAVSSKNGTVQVHINTPGKYSIKLFTIQGKLIHMVKGGAASSDRVTIPIASQNALIAQISGDGWAESSILYSQK
jgi:hypothetical protein